jgi:tyrosine-specific transport protein
MAVFIYSGAKFVDYFGRVLMIGLVASYAALVAIATPHININQLTIGHAKYLFPVLAIVIAAFGYHVIIPSLRMYLQDDVGKLKKTIFLGSIIPLIVYIVWELIVFGIIPIHGEYGLLMILKVGDPATRLTNDLAVISASNLLTISARFFVIFAIASSFLGIAFSLFDFLADGFKIEKTPFGKTILLLLTFLPPFLFVLLYPKGFLFALSYAGVFVAILHGIIPTAMVWLGRKKGLMRRYKVIGGKVFLSIILLFSILVIVSNFKFFL